MKHKILIILLSINLQAFSQQIIFDLPGFSIVQLNSNAQTLGTGGISTVSSGYYLMTGFFQNPALLAGREEWIGLTVSYLPYLRNLVPDHSLNDLGLLFSPDTINSFGYHLFISHSQDLSDGFLTDVYNYFHHFAWSRSLGKHLDLGAGLKYMVNRRQDADISIYDPLIRTFAVDLGMIYRTSFSLPGISLIHLNAGASIDNFGPRVAYLETTTFSKSFIPTKLGTGLMIAPELYLGNDFSLDIELAGQLDKFLTPSEPEYADLSGVRTIVAGMDPDISIFRALYQSFYDSPDGFKGELEELIIKYGSEVRLNYREKLSVAIRGGHYFEQVEQLENKYYTYGGGLRFYGYSLDFVHFGRNNPNSWGISAAYLMRI